ncbi:MAG: FG-GAP repeat protein [Ignavibacteria bacterium]|nr:FG-GAP repeat protein [Ignavibacteria bacterium]
MTILGCQFPEQVMNGDGYSDVLVGAYGYSSYTGRAHLYFGVHP